VASSWFQNGAGQISKLFQAVDKFKRNNFPFGKDFKSSTKFELKIQEVMRI
jgi:hypothetical protein